MYDTNGLRIGDTVHLNTDTGTRLAIVALLSRTSITIKAVGVASIDVALGDRLVPRSKPPIYDSVTGERVTVVVNLNSLGFFQISTYEQAVDYILSGPGLVSQLFIDHRSGAVSNQFNVLDYGAVGDGVTDDEPALNRLFDYVARFGNDAGLATVYFPRGIYLVNDTLILSGENQGLTVAKNVCILGEPGATIKLNTAGWNTASTRLLWIGRAGVAHENFILENLILDGSSYGGGGGEAAAITAFETNILSRLKVKGCTFKNIGNTSAGIALPNDGIRLGGAAGGGTAYLTEDFEIEGCRFVNCERNGITGINTKDGFVHHSHFEGFENAAIDFEPNTVSEYNQKNRFESLTIKNARTLAIYSGPGAGGAGTISANVADTIIANTVIDIPVGSSARGIVFHNMLRGKVLHTTIIGNSAGGADAVGIRSCKDCTVDDVTIHDPVNSTAAIFVDGALLPVGSGNKIVNSSIRDASRHGILATSELDLLVSNNTLIVTASSSFRAINIGAGTRTRVLGNGILGPWLVGISIADSGCTDCVVVGNISDGGTNSEINDVGTRTVVLGNKTAGSDAGTASGNQVGTVLYGGPIAGADVNKRWTSEANVAANAGPGTVAVVTPYTHSTLNANIILNPKNEPACRMMAGINGTGGAAGRAPYPTRTATGFNITHEGNPDAGTAAIFGWTIFQ